MAKAAKTDETRTLYCETQAGTLRKIVVPSSWVMTFGPIGVGVQRNGQESPNVLRLYTDASKKDLVGVYRDIKSVSDERVSVTEKKIVKRQKTFHKKGSNGDQTYAAELRTTVWENPYADEPEAVQDDFDDTVLKLPSGLEADE